LPIRHLRSNRFENVPSPRSDFRWIFSYRSTANEDISAMVQMINQDGLFDAVPRLKNPNSKRDVITHAAGVDTAKIKIGKHLNLFFRARFYISHLPTAQFTPAQP
jgi:hypothetical protein